MKQETNYELSSVAKFALFDTITGKRITDYEYDRILTNHGENHVLVKCEDFVDNNGKHFPGLGKITYSAIADADGNIVEVEGLTLGTSGGFNNGVCVAFENATGKFCLINGTGKTISETYSHLEPTNRENVFGLYKNVEYNEAGKLKNVDIVYENGKKVDLKIKEFEYNPTYNAFLQLFRFHELMDIKSATDAIKKYGANVIEFLPNKIFDFRENYMEIIFAVNDRCVKLNRKSSELLYTIGVLSNLLAVFEPLKKDFPPLKLPKKIAGETEEIKAKIEEYITKFYSILN